MPALLPYILYLLFVLRLGQGPVDYETFMSIGKRFLNHQQIYVENSYYPLPFVMIFALFSALPKWLSLMIWLSLPVAIALFITKGHPWVFLFAPLFAHFVGGQSSWVGMLGLWGYLTFPAGTSLWGGCFLALAFLKPQLAVLPFLHALMQWWRYIWSHHKVPRQAVGWLISMVVLFLPAFLLLPDWFTEWLSQPRPLFIRALSGLLPRLLLSMFKEPSPAFWFTLTFCAVFLLLILGLVWGRKISFDIGLLWYFLVSPLVHDYDLIQLIPIVDKQRSRQTVAILASLPGWLTILFAYQNDSAWLTFSLYCPGFAVPGAHQLAQCGQLEIWRIVNSFSFVRRYFICQLVDRLSHLAGSSI